MAGAGFHSIAKLRTQIFNPGLADRGLCSADCNNENGRTADCQSQEYEFESGMPKAWTYRRVRIRPESGGWQSAEQLRADYQAVILIVANRGIGARSLATEWNPAPAPPFCIERPPVWSFVPIFLIRDFTSLKLIRGVLFRPKLNTNGLSWHNISWHYNFKMLPYCRSLQTWADFARLMMHSLRAMSDLLIYWHSFTLSY
jgi:hypothetical protein